MGVRLVRTAWISGALALFAAPAAAHHPMGAKLPSTLWEGALSGLGHPIIGIDHFAAVVAVGCLAALHRTGAALAIGYVLATMVGAAIHVQGATLPAAEAVVALSVVALGIVLMRRTSLDLVPAVALFVAAGLLHGYALGEAIVGAEPTPLVAYFAGLALVQWAIALGIMLTARMVLQPVASELAPVRLLGAGVVGVGLTLLIAQLVPGS